jgi:hypothetical protein
MFRPTLAALALMAALPAMAQDRGGLRPHDPTAVLDQIEANRGCQLSSTSVSVGINKATSNGAAARQQLSTVQNRDPSGCRPLVSTRVVAGFNIATGRGALADQTIESQGTRGALATTTFTRGANVGAGALSTANQRLINQIGR